jgi:hypothetical protein
MPVKAIDLSNQTFGRLTVIDRANNRGQYVCWNCLCECGAKVVVSSADLRRGDTRSCGCLAKETWQRISLAKKHGHSGDSRTPEYRSWESAKQRCFNPNTTGYKNYGGRGITMCATWANDFSSFLESMGPRPEGTSLDRINVDGNYEPGNCRWADRSMQRNNRRR